MIFDPKIWMTIHVVMCFAYFCTAAWAGSKHFNKIWGGACYLWLVIGMLHFLDWLWS